MRFRNYPQPFEMCKHILGNILLLEIQIFIGKFYIVIN